MSHICRRHSREPLGGITPLRPLWARLRRPQKVFDLLCCRNPRLSPCLQPSDGPFQLPSGHADVPLGRGQILMAHQCLKFGRWDAGRGSLCSEGVAQVVCGKAGNAGIQAGAISIRLIAFLFSRGLSYP